MRYKNKLVSVIIPFYNTVPQFMKESIDSVFQQTYQDWEILLIDDGANTECSQLALVYANLFKERVFYLEHPNHQNKGASATRQLGIEKAKGEYISFLDADDIWLPQKLTKQVELLDAQPEAGMTYANTLYWYSWSGDPNDKKRDTIPPLGITPQTILYPPELLLLYLQGKAAIPCMGSLLVRQSAVIAVGGFEEEFRGLIDDQVFYAKICLNFPVLAVDECWDYYRQHPISTTAVAHRAGQMCAVHIRYLNWLEGYLNQTGNKSSELRQAIKRGLWFYQNFRLLGFSINNRSLIRWIKKWMLRIEAAVLPKSLRRRLWLGSF